MPPFILLSLTRCFAALPKGINIFLYCLADLTTLGFNAFFLKKFPIFFIALIVSFTCFIGILPMSFIILSDLTNTNNVALITPKVTEPIPTGIESNAIPDTARPSVPIAPATRPICLNFKFSVALCN